MPELQGMDEGPTMSELQGMDEGPTHAEGQRRPTRGPAEAHEAQVSPAHSREVAL